MVPRRHDERYLIRVRVPLTPPHGIRRPPSLSTPTKAGTPPSAYLRGGCRVRCEVFDTPEWWIQPEPKEPLPLSPPSLPPRSAPMRPRPSRTVCSYPAVPPPESSFLNWVWRSDGESTARPRTAAPGPPQQCSLSSSLSVPELRRPSCSSPPAHLLGSGPRTPQPAFPVGRPPQQTLLCTPRPARAPSGCRGAAVPPKARRGSSPGARLSSPWGGAPFGRWATERVARARLGANAPRWRC
eukprot:TRINITY_DN18087_c0_g1_i1.p2 TRINITY_DN18087_c0_g1~~TRINITY_DN18087_c0_g1_i1.p2  ORF type:complete len:240 (+),score=32.35 TRINITY_DN18087_c0_g1_i1:59-778(+)